MDQPPNVSSATVDDPVAAERPIRTVALKLPAAEVARAALVVIGLGAGLYLLWTIHAVTA